MLIKYLLTIGQPSQHCFLRKKTSPHVLVPQMAELRTLFGFEEFWLVSGIGEVDRSVEVWRLVVVFGVLWCFLQVVTSTFTQVTSVVELTIINK